MIAAVPSSVAAFAAVVSARRARQTHAEVRTNHGLRAGEYLELVSANILDLKTSLDDHTANDTEQFEALQRQISNLQ